MARVLITGGAGFIGSHLTTALIDANHEVRVLDDFSTGRRANLAHVSGRFELLEGSICDREQCDAACENIDFVFHQAAVPSVPKSVEDPQCSHRTNIDGTFNLLLAAVERKVGRVIYAASSSAYGETAESPKHEGIRPEPLSPYAVQKLAGELYGRAFSECFGLETISLRYFNVFGTRQDPTSQYAAAIPAFATALLRGQPPTVYGDGEQTRDFTHVQNVVQANLLAMKADRTWGEAVNVACGQAISVNEVIATINRLLGTEIRPHYTAPRAGDVRHSCADIRLAEELLGYNPTVTFEDGLKQTIEYYAELVSADER